jgi:hypothetical protein
MRNAFPSLTQKVPILQHHPTNNLNRASSNANPIDLNATTNTSAFIRMRKGGGNPTGLSGLIFSDFDNSNIYNFYNNILAWVRTTNLTKQSNQLNGQVYGTNEFTLMTLANNGRLTTAAGFDISSDRRLKENIEPINEKETHLKILQLQPKTYNLISDPDEKHVGLIAQEVKEVFPLLVSENREGMMSLCYDGISILMLQSIKQLQKQIDELKNEIIELRK